MFGFLNGLFPGDKGKDVDTKKGFGKVKEPTVEEEDVNITFSLENSFYKIEVSDYASLSKFNEILSSNKEFDSIVNDINFINVFWNSKKEKINKGIYYIITVEDKTYCILIDRNEILVYEKIKKDIDEETLKENITEERILKFDINTKQYSYASYKHDQFGSSYYHMFYDNYKEAVIPEFELSKNDAFKEIKELINNLDNIPNIVVILDTTLFKEYILKDLNPDALQRVRIPVDKS